MVACQLELNTAEGVEARARYDVMEGLEVNSPKVAVRTRRCIQYAVARLEEYQLQRNCACSGTEVSKRLTKR